LHLRLLDSRHAAALVRDARAPDLGRVEREREPLRKRNVTSALAALLERGERVVDRLDPSLAEPPRATVRRPQELRHQ
jgi:hypothetical protein